MNRPEVVVVGAGIIGLVSAYELAREGRAVLVIDPTPGAGATYAAAGMLAPGAEYVAGEDENFQLQRSAVARWRTLSESLEAVTAQSVTVHEVGTLLVGFDHGDRLGLTQTHDLAVAAGIDVSVRRRSEHPDSFRHLNDRLTSGLFYPGEAWIDPDEAVAALTSAISALGGTFLAARVTATSEEAQSIRLSTTEGDVEAPCALFATGAQAPPLSQSLEHSVRPIRGVTMRCDGVDRFGLPMVRAVVRGRPFYMVGRDGGHCVVGATAQEAGGDAIEIGEMRRLLTDALDVVPPLEVAAWTQTRVGHRPVAPSGVPFFEHQTGTRWAWSSGHYRHGVTLAPLAGQWAVDFVSEVVS